MYSTVAMTKLVAAVVTCSQPFSRASAQTAASFTGSIAPRLTATVAARPGDVDSIDHILAAVYDVISGPPGPRDWDRFRSLFYSGARLIPTRRDDKGVVSARVSYP